MLYSQNKFVEMSWCCIWVIIFCAYWGLLSLHMTELQWLWSFDGSKKKTKTACAAFTLSSLSRAAFKRINLGLNKVKVKRWTKAEMIKAVVIELNGSGAERRGDCWTASLYWKQYTDGKERKRNMGPPGYPSGNTHIIWQYLHNRETQIAQTDVCGFFLATKKGLRVTCLHSLEALQKWCSYIWHNELYGGKNRPTCSWMVTKCADHDLLIGCMFRSLYLDCTGCFSGNFHSPIFSPLNALNVHFWRHHLMRKTPRAIYNDFVLLPKTRSRIASLAQGCQHSHTEPSWHRFHTLTLHMPFMTLTFSFASPSVVIQSALNGLWWKTLMNQSSAAWTESKQITLLHAHTGGAVNFQAVQTENIYRCCEVQRGESVVLILISYITETHSVWCNSCNVLLSIALHWVHGNVTISFTLT